MFEISKQDIDKYKLIGSASSSSFGLCVYFAQKHAKDFSKRAVGYHVEKGDYMSEMMNETARQAGFPEDKQKNITISFYEEKIIS